MVSPSEKCWFGVNSKTFEISVNEAKGKVFRIVCERRTYFSSWIRFNGKALFFILEGAKNCCFLKVGEHLKKAWVEGGRKHQLELCTNKAGRFLFFTTCDVGAWWGDGKGVADQPPFLDSLKSWAQSSWMLKGNLCLALLGGSFILFEFEDVVEVERVLHLGVKWFKGKCLILAWWKPSVGCLTKDGKS